MQKSKIIYIEYVIFNKMMFRFRNSLCKFVSENT